MANKVGRNKEKCKKYNNSGTKEINKLARQERHKKRINRFERRRSEGKNYEYNPVVTHKKYRDCIPIGANLWSNRAKHTYEAQITSVFRKLNNEIEQRKAEEKIKLESKINNKSKVERNALC